MVRRPPHIVPAVFVDEADDPEYGEGPVRDWVAAKDEDRYGLADNDDGIFDGMDPAPGPAKDGGVLVVDAVDVKA